MLDGDWCWHMDPFIVNDETKAMVEKNIIHLLNAYLACSHLDHIVFCWVLPSEDVLNRLVEKLVGEFELHFITLICSEVALKDRLNKDIERGERSRDIVGRSLQRLKNYESMSSSKMDVTDISTDELTENIIELIEA